MAYFVGHSLAAVGAPGDVHTSQKNPLGMRLVDSDENEWIYLKGVTGCLADDWVTYTSNTWTAVRLIADAVGMVAITPAAIDAATKYGWFLVKGYYATANSDTVAAAGGLFIDGTTGRVDDASVAGDFVNGAVSTAADSTNKLPVHINYPYVTNTAPA